MIRMFFVALVMGFGLIAGGGGVGTAIACSVSCDLSVPTPKVPSIVAPACSGQCDLMETPQKPIVQVCVNSCDHTAPAPVELKSVCGANCDFKDQPQPADPAKSDERQREPRMIRTACRSCD